MIRADVAVIDAMLVERGANGDRSIRPLVAVEVSSPALRRPQEDHEEHDTRIRIELRIQRQ